MMRLAFFALFLGFAVPASAVEEPCVEKGEKCWAWGNNGHGVRRGDRTLAEVNGIIRRVRVLREHYDSDVTIASNRPPYKINISADKIAITKPGNCVALTSEFCVGRNVALREPDREARIAGFFPVSGDLIVEDDGGYRRIPRTAARPLPHQAASGNLARLLSRVWSQISSTENLQACRVEDEPAPTQSASGKSQLLSRIRSGDRPIFSEFLRDSLPESGPPGNRSPWSNCRNQSRADRHIKTDESGELLPGCAPEVVYTWMSPARLRAMEFRMGNGDWPKRVGLMGRPHFASRTPAATFGYGSYDENGGIPMRIRLRPGIQFKFVGTEIPECDKIPDEESANTVYVRSQNGPEGHRTGVNYSFEDMIFCHSGVIESWSYGTRGFYNELIRDLAFATDPKTRGEWASYKWYSDGTGSRPVPQLLDISADEHPFTQEQLLGSITRALQMSENGEGRVYYNPAYRETRPPHFSATNPAWFQNPADGI